MTGRRLPGGVRVAMVPLLAMVVLLAAACTTTNDRPVEAEPSWSATPTVTPTVTPTRSTIVPPDRLTFTPAGPEPLNPDHRELEFDYGLPIEECLPPEELNALRRIDPDAAYEIVESRSSEHEQNVQTLVCSYLRADLPTSSDEPQPTHVYLTTVTWLYREKPLKFGSGTNKTIPVASHDLVDWYHNAWAARDYDDWRVSCQHLYGNPCEKLRALTAEGSARLLLFDGHIGNLQITADMIYADAELPDIETAYETMTALYRDIVLSEIARRPHQDHTP